MKYIAIFLIKLYKKYIAGGIDTKCRFYPTCSVYAMISIADHGIFKGGAYATSRILRCNPYGKHGEDKPKLSKRKYRNFL